MIQWTHVEKIDIQRHNVDSRLMSDVLLILLRARNNVDNEAASFKIKRQSSRDSRCWRARNHCIWCEPTTRVVMYQTSKSTYQQPRFLRRSWIFSLSSSYIVLSSASTQGSCLYLGMQPGLQSKPCSVLPISVHSVDMIVEEVCVEVVVAVRPDVVASA